MERTVGAYAGALVLASAAGWVVVGLLSEMGVEMPGWAWVVVPAWWAWRDWKSVARGGAGGA